MSIHEVIWDTQGRITGARCVDDEIVLHQEKPTEVVSELNGHPVITVIHRSPHLWDTIVLGGHPDSVLPFTSHSLTAETTDSVREVRSITGLDYDGKITAVVLFDRTFVEDEINQLSLKTDEGERGYVWTKPGQQIEVYVAPQHKSLGQKVRQVFAQVLS